MKTLKRAVLFFVLMATVNRLAAQSKHTEEMTVPLSEPGKPVTLEAHLMKGSIKVIGYEGKEVIVQVFMDSTKDRDGDEDRDDDSRGMKRIGSTGGMDVRADEDHNTVRISSSAENKLAGLTIKVPQNTARINVGTINGGDITVSDVSGKIEINNVNGGITATGISGSVVANTVNGDVIVKFKSVDAGAAMSFSNLNGRVDVTLPADTKADFKLKCERGEMFTDFDIDVDKTRPRVDKKDEDHFHQIKIDDWVLGKINGGGSELMMESQFGSIYIRKAK
ncbi:MAG TPA: hypothetical protein VNV35_01195 [Puia sp.]|jgi:hypothetical protein|nr:hypothetical protein [Puia sp.]